MTAGLEARLGIEAITILYPLIWKGRLAACRILLTKRRKFRRMCAPHVMKVPDRIMDILGSECRLHRRETVIAWKVEKEE